MKDLKHAKPTKLLWIDLEMTGLDANKDVILEIAAEITDFTFKPIASYEARVAHDPQVVQDLMKKNVWWESYPENRDDFLSKLQDAIPQDMVRNELTELIKKHFGDEPAILAGNSVHADRSFIEAHWPDVFKLLHYRMLDVTAWKVVMQGKYDIEYVKKETHRAFDDIHESIEELEFYLKNLRVK